MDKFREPIKKSKWRFVEYVPYLVMAAIFVASVIKFIEYGERKIYAAVIMLCFATFIAMYLVSSLTNRRIDRINETQNWLIDATNWNVERIKAHGLYMLPDGTAQENTSLPVNRWPWGSHHTELLGHLEAAARKFWTLYDSDDPSTAPTNEMVSDWLHKERGVSKEKAKAIASILRPDGLPTGPRR